MAALGCQGSASAVLVPSPPVDDDRRHPLMLKSLTITSGFPDPWSLIPVNSISKTKPLPKKEEAHHRSEIIQLSECRTLVSGVIEDIYQQGSPQSAPH